MSRPKPETREAYLMSESAWVFTLHTYHSTEEAWLPGPDGEVWEFLYKCSKTGVLRRWGVVARTAEEVN